MNDRNTIKLDDYRNGDEPDPMKVKCAKCGDLIYRHATRCPQCGVHFSGEAYEFAHSSDLEEAHGSVWWKWFMLLAAVLAILGIVFASIT